SIGRCGLVFGRRGSFRFRKRGGAAGQAAQIGNDVGALVILLQSSEAHCGPRNILLRRQQEFVEMVVIPDNRTALGKVLHGSRIPEAFMRSDRTIDDIPKVGPNLVGPALVPGVTARTLLEGALSGRCIGAGKKRGDRNSSLLGGSASFPVAFRNRDGKAFRFRSSRMENPFGSNR